MPKSRLVLIGKPDIHSENSGMAKIAEISDEEHDIFVRIHSFDETKQHVQFNEFIQPDSTIMIVINPTKRC